MATLASLAIELTANSASLVNEMKRVNNSMDSFERKSKAVASMAKKSFIGLAAAIGSADIVGSIVRTSASFESLNASLETVFGSQEKAAQQFKAINDFASQTPYSIQELTEAMIKMQALGLDPSTEALRSMGNTASAMGKDLMQFTEAVADAVTGEFERLKEFGIRSSSEGDRVKFVFQGITTEVGKNAEEIQKYLLDIGNTTFAGSIEQQAQTLDGVLSTFGGTVDTLAAKFAEESGLTQAIKDAVTWVTNFINTVILAEPTVQGLEKKIADLNERLASPMVSGRNKASLEAARSEYEELLKDLVIPDLLSEDEPTIDIGAAAGPDSNILDLTNKQLQAKRELLEKSFLTEQELLNNQAQFEVDLLIDSLNRKQITQDQFYMLSEKQKEKHVKRMQELEKTSNRQVWTEEQKQHRNILSSTAQFFGVMAKEHKAFAIGEALINTYLGVSQSLAAYPMPVAAIMAATHVAAGLQAVQSIRSGGGAGGTASAPAIPDIDAQNEIIAANDESATVEKNVIINVSGISEDSLLTPAQRRQIIDEINEAEGSNTVIRGI